MQDPWYVAFVVFCFGENLSKTQSWTSKIVIQMFQAENFGNETAESEGHDSVSTTHEGLNSPVASETEDQPGENPDIPRRDQNSDSDNDRNNAADDESSCEEEHESESSDSDDSSSDESDSSGEEENLNYVR